MYKITSFSLTDNICADDFNKKISAYINLSKISSILEPRKFYMPLSGQYINSFSIVRMVDGSVFSILENEYNNLCLALSIKKDKCLIDISDQDIATVERMHDMLNEVIRVPLGDELLVKSRGLSNRMAKSLYDTKDK